MLTLTETQTIVLNIGGKEAMRIEPSGRFMIEGRCVETNKKEYERFLDLIKRREVIM